MQAIILAGGKGIRLRPYTTFIPKPLMPIGEKPIIELILKKLIKYGVDEVFISVNHLSSLIKLLIGESKKWGINIHYIEEDEALGTVGCLSLIKKEKLNNNFLLLNGDLLTTLNISNLYNFHLEKNAYFTASVFNRTVHVDFGVLDINYAFEITNYREKPTFSYNVSMGINALSKHCFDIVCEYVDKNGKMDVPDLVKLLIQSDRKVSSYREDCYWLDIGRIEDYEKALSDAENCDHILHKEFIDQKNV